MNLKTTAITLGAITTLGAGVNDAVILKEIPLERVEMIAEERVEAKQIDNIVETTFPWKDQNGLKVVVDLGEPTISERLADKRKKEVITEVVDFGEGGFKVDILLNEKPDTNRFCYAIEGAENYDFFYQPALTEEEIEQGAERPEDIVGSYAVYHKTLKNHVVGQENYATGKVMHIPRPQVWELNDEENMKEWAELSYSEKEGLCVTVRQDFLDSAKYPVRVDPTFGYTSVGGGSVSLGANAFRGVTVNSTVSENGTVASVSYYGRKNAANNMKGAVITTSGVILTNGITSATALQATAQWHIMTFSIPPTVSSSTSYYPVVIWDGTAYRYGDTGVAGDGVLDSSNNYSSPTDPTDLVTTNNVRMSVYATYSGSSTPATPSNEAAIMFQ